MKNKDIHEWLLDNCIDSLLTIKDTKGAEIYLTDLLTKHLTEQLQQHGVSGKRPTQKEIHLKSIDAKNIRKQFGYSVSEYVQYHDGFLDGIKWYQAACADTKGGQSG